MSKKNWLIQKLKGKSDSHGTTLCNEEIQFQRGSDENQVKRLSDVISRSQAKSVLPLHKKNENPPVPPKTGVHVLPSRSKDDSDIKNGNAVNFSNGNVKKLDYISSSTSNNGNDSNKNQGKLNGFLKNENRLSSGPDKLNNNTKTKLSLSASADSALIKPNLMKLHSSPRGPRKLIKPGVPNAPQPNFKKPPLNTNKDVLIQDEYSDPFDALHADFNDGERVDSLEQPTATDGYVEPYDFNMLGGGGQQNGNINNDVADLQANGSDQISDLYQDPWDKAKYPNPQNNNILPPTTANALNQKQDYEDPWDRTNLGTLQYSTSQRKGAQVDKRLVHNHPNFAASMHDSWGSGGSSSSSSPPINPRQRLICVNPRRHSPATSPKFDHRLILPKDSDARYSEPWGNCRSSKPVDKRLIKAEPSLEELRRMSPRGTDSTGTASPLSSGRGSPMGTLSAPQSSEDLTHTEVRRASTPYVSPHGMTAQPMPVSRLAASKSKSRSLDIRNQQQNLAAMRCQMRRNDIDNFPKSASDDQLVGMQQTRHPQNLTDVGEYEEPWDKAINDTNSVSHTRSRSYELHHPSAGNMKTYYRTGRDAGHDIYDKPWDRNDQDTLSQSGHLQSMQRFQQRKLELHPSEAFGAREINTMLRLEHQSWYHGNISREEAVHRLKAKPEGSYLVRVSETCRNNYTLSLQAPNGCVHMRMSKTRDQKWILGEFSKPFSSVPEMIAYYTRNKLEVDKNKLIPLLHPVPDSML